MTRFSPISSDDVISEDIILRWYKKDHSPKGKSIFLEQMKKFIEWLNSAEEGESCCGRLLFAFY